MIKKTGLMLLILISLSVSGQTKDPYLFLSALKEKYYAVKDYSVDARIKVDIKFLKIQQKEAKVCYKYPNKVNVQTRGFALLPKKASCFDPQTFIGEQYTAIYINSEKWDSCIIDVVKTIPSNADNDVILSTFWIDDKNRQIRKFEVNSKTGGTYQVELFYNNLPYDLPEKIIVTFNIKDMSIPKTLTGELTDEEIADSIKKDKRGKVTILYSNYLVNIGLDDKIFSIRK
jgi:outer membrane lipoprotein-sorting protein